MTAAADRLRQLLALATPGPWHANVNDLIGGWCIGTAKSPASETREAENVADMMDERNARLIALAPELASLCADMADALELFIQHRAVSYDDITWLLARLDTLTADAGPV